MLKKYLDKHGLDQSELDKEKQQSRIYTSNPDYTWDGVEVIKYKPEGDDWAGIIRQVIIGYREETDFHVRYFEIAPGGYSSLEKHLHSHAVIIIRGQGKAILGDKALDLKYLDTVYVSPDTPHQFINDGTEPFGFLCMVDAERDKPRPIELEELSVLEESATTKHVVKAIKVKMLEQ
jgi:quercetin dioxygenase-like cupin family protein